MKTNEASFGFSVVSEQELLLEDKTLIELISSILAKKASFRFKVKGFSMLPFIREGDIVTVSPLSERAAGLGRPVAFVHPVSKKLVIHRIVAVEKDCYLIKGDSCFEADGRVQKENLLGSVSKIERIGRKKIWCLGPERFLITFLSRLKIISFALCGWNKLPERVKKIIKRSGII